MDSTIFCYLAEPIDQAPQTAGRYTSVDQLAAGLQSAGYNVYRPARAWRVGGRPDPRIERVNRAALYDCDCVIAWLPAGQPSIGVPMEIQAATDRGIPAVVITSVESVALAGVPLVTVVGSLCEAIEAVPEVLRDRPKPQGAADTGRVQFVLREGAEMPSRAYPDDAGIDLVCAEDATIPPGTFMDIPSTVEAAQLPPGCWGMITNRSSTLRKKGLHIPIGVIDPGWRGPLYTGVWNLGPQPVLVQEGERLAQLILIDNATARHVLVQVGQVDPHSRGLNGFGSSGR